jgi:putative ABC transport system ATP-binding protein
MTGETIIELRGVEKMLGESSLRINEFTFRENAQVVLAGLPGVMGEAFMNLIVGALLPDAGDVIVFGQNTKEIRTDTEWLQSLDRFGLVSNRAVLLDQSTVAQNLALPLTLAIDPMSAETRAEVDSLAREVDLPVDILDRPVNALDADPAHAAVRARLHLARALAHRPRVLLLEHPTLTAEKAGAQFGSKLRSIAGARTLSFIAVSDDDSFARESGGQRLRVELTGDVRSAGAGLRRFLPFGWGG